MIDNHMHSPLVIVIVWSALIFGMGWLVGAALGWLARGWWGS